MQPLLFFNFISQIMRRITPTFMFFTFSRYSIHIISKNSHNYLPGLWNCLRLLRGSRTQRNLPLPFSWRVCSEESKLHRRFQSNQNNLVCLKSYEKSDHFCDQIFLSKRFNKLTSYTRILILRTIISDFLILLHIKNLR